MINRDMYRPQAEDQNIESLVQELDNLHCNVHVQANILSLGKRAVPALVRFLLGPPSQFPEGRVLAAEALGYVKGEAAFQGLVQALDPSRLDGLSPILRLSEEDVQNAVACQLARLGEQRAIPALRDALRRHRLLGAAEALVQLREESALPWLVEGLEDAFKRGRFSRAILEMGGAAIPFLTATLEQRRMFYQEELLPSIERRAEALRLLGLLHAKTAVNPIRTALCDHYEKVRTEAALALVEVEMGDRAFDAVPALLAGLTHPDFLQRDRCAEAILRIGPAAIPFVKQAVCQRDATVERESILFSAHARQAALALLTQLGTGRPC